ncbi:MAG: hypothetical protein IBX45_05350 [Campylobacterales bacterium]|nr:hypothetical protein [Campylobacterales bacterium]
MGKWFLIIPMSMVVLFFAGCTPSHNNLNPEQKRELYEQIAQEVHSHQSRGEVYEKIGYLGQAVQEYEQANFYAKTAESKKIKTLRARIEEEGASAYQRGDVALAKKEYERALKEFNTVLRMNAEHGEAKQKRDALLASPSLSKQFNDKTAKLNALLALPSPKVKEQEEIERRVNELLHWQHDHPAALAHKITHFEEKHQQSIEGLAQIEKGHKALLENDLETAETAFKHARGLSATRKEALQGLVALQKRKDAIYYHSLSRREYTKNNTAQALRYSRQSVEADQHYFPTKEFLAQLTEEQGRLQSKARIQKGREYLKNHRYIEALEESHALLKLTPHNVEAKELLLDIKKSINKNLPQLLKEGEELFSQNRLEEAAQRFESVLVINPDNAISLTYLKRINSRQETVQMLSH